MGDGRDAAPAIEDGRQRGDHGFGRKAKASTKLLFPVPFGPTRKVGLSSFTTVFRRLRKRLSVMDYTSVVSL